MRPRRLKNEINVVPYIDVMLVLLVIFMISAPMMTTGNVELPSIGKAKEVPAKPLEVAIKADESLTLIDRNVAGGRERSVSRSELAGLIQAAQARNPNQPVLIAGDKNVKYDAVLAVMNELQRADIKRVGLLVQTPGR